MQNQVQKNMDNYLETGVIQGVIGDSVIRGGLLKHLLLKGACIGYHVLARSSCFLPNKL